MNTSIYNIIGFYIILTAILMMIGATHKTLTMTSQMGALAGAGVGLLLSVILWFMWGKTHYTIPM
jgi:hypothetical protein